jgi:hypothetical protein
MDNIFASATTSALEVNGPQTGGSLMQYNLFYNSGAPAGQVPNYGPINGDPRFKDAANGDFSLLPDSAAIDSARSELRLDPGVSTLRAISDQSLVGQIGGIRNANFRLPGRGNDPLNILSLPGYSVREPGLGASPAPFPNQSFHDQWIPQSISTNPSAANGYQGPASTPGVTFNYTPITGERDSLGYLRIDDTARANIGTGSRPFFDIGAFEYRQLNPPHVINDSASASTGGGIAAFIPNSSGSGTQAVDIYKVESGANAGKGTAGLNVAPNRIEVAFDSLLDKNTLNSQTIVLQASGGDGIFGNANSAQDKFIDLSGKLVYDTTSRKLTIKLADSNLVLPSDLYRVTIFGNGSNVVRDLQGNALDGENLDGAGLQKDLPSGDGFPGGNFVFSFSIDTNPPILSPGTVTLAPSSDSGARDFITNDNTPTVTGSMTDVSPRNNGLVGDIVYLDYAGPDGRFGRLIPGATAGTFIPDPTDPFGLDDVLNIGSALTTAGVDANGNPIGNFAVTVGQDAANTGRVRTGYTMPDSNYSVGRDGIFGTADDLGASIVRARVVDQSGNPSNANDSSGITGFWIDTKAPIVVGQDPAPATQATVVNGQVMVKVGFNENLDQSTVNAGTIQVIRAGGDGIFGNGNDVTVPISSNITFTPQLINGVPTPGGAQLMTFFISSAAANDIYQVTILGGAGSNNVVRDVARNPMAGNYTTNFIVFNASAVNRIFVDGSATNSNPGALQGTRANPYRTIQDGINAATVGDIVEVLPGIYNENVTLKSYVRVLSADPSSTDALFVPGNALKTIIRPVAVTDPTTGVTSYNPIAVTGHDLASLSNVQTELAGFTITNGLTGDPNRGTITAGSVGLLLTNSDILVDSNYFTDSELGASVIVGGNNVPAASFQNNGFIGNYAGLLINNIGANQLRGGAWIEVANNTIAYNTLGVYVSSASATPFVDVANNIIAFNRSKTTPVGGTGVIASAPGLVTVRGNLFSSNGAQLNSSVDDAINIGNYFDPNLLGSTPDILRNFVGNPGFANARDPRPEGDGPALFFVDANFDLTLASGAIDNALAYLAPRTDFLGRGRVDIANKGFAGVGPADIGAFEYNGIGGFATTTGTTTTTGGGLGGGFLQRSAGLSQEAAAPAAATAAASTATTTAAITPQAADAVFNDPTTTADTTPTLNSTPTVVVSTPATSTPASRLAARRQALKAKLATRQSAPHPAAYFGSRFRKG